MHGIFRGIIVVALLVTFLPMADAQRRKKRDYNALDPEKFDRVIKRLVEDANVLSLSDGKLITNLPDRGNGAENHWGLFFVDRTPKLVFRDRPASEK